MSRYVNLEFWDIISDDAKYFRTNLEYYRLLQAGGFNSGLDRYMPDEYLQMACTFPLRVLHVDNVKEWFEKRDTSECWLKDCYIAPWNSESEFLHITEGDTDMADIFLHDFDFSSMQSLYYTNFMRFVNVSNWQMDMVNWMNFEHSFEFYYVVLQCWSLSGRVQTYVTRDTEDGMSVKCGLRYKTLCRRCYGDFEESNMYDINVFADMSVADQYDRLHSVYEIHQRTLAFNTLIPRGGYTHFLRIMYAERDLMWCNRCGIPCFHISIDEDITEDALRYDKIPSNILFSDLIVKYNLNDPGAQQVANNPDEDEEGWLQAPQ